MNDELTPALEAARRGQIEAWVHEFLLGVGRNLPFSEGLKRQPRFWLGPLEIPLDALEICCGPDPDLEYVVDADGFERHVTSMADSLAKGWKPAPLIASYDAGKLSIRDGNHRYAALRRSGVERYWVVVWFNSPEEQRSYMNLKQDRQP
ncbi:MAG: ParB N-terminal domain-containing protein [Anaerolineaceae bacterium]|nr:ParB N-terminal domain-containing protein [Anaerolineaceae bacterium]